MKISVKLKSGEAQTLTLKRVEVEPGLVDGVGRPILALWVSEGGDVEVFQFRSISGAPRWTSRINNGKCWVNMSSAYKRRSEVGADVRFYMRAYKGRLR